MSPTWPMEKTNNRSCNSCAGPVLTDRMKSSSDNNTGQSDGDPVILHIPLRYLGRRDNEQYDRLSGEGDVQIYNSFTVIENLVSMFTDPPVSPASYRHYGYISSHMENTSRVLCYRALENTVEYWDNENGLGKDRRKGDSQVFSVIDSSFPFLSHKRDALHDDNSQDCRNQSYLKPQSLKWNLRTPSRLLASIRHILPSNMADCSEKGCGTHPSDATAVQQSEPLNCHHKIDKNTYEVSTTHDKRNIYEGVNWYNVHEMSSVITVQTHEHDVEQKHTHMKIYSDSSILNLKQQIPHSNVDYCTANTNTTDGTKKKKSFPPPSVSVTNTERNIPIVKSYILDTSHPTIIDNSHNQKSEHICESNRSDSDATVVYVNTVFAPDPRCMQLSALIQRTNSIQERLVTSLIFSSIHDYEALGGQFSALLKALEFRIRERYFSNLNLSVSPLPYGSLETSCVDIMKQSSDEIGRLQDKIHFLNQQAADNEKQWKERTVTLEKALQDSQEINAALQKEIISLSDQLKQRENLMDQIRNIPEVTKQMTYTIGKETFGESWQEHILHIRETMQVETLTENAKLKDAIKKVLSEFEIKHNKVVDHRYALRQQTALEALLEDQEYQWKIAKERLKVEKQTVYDACKTEIQLERDAAREEIASSIKRHNEAYERRISELETMYQDKMQQLASQHKHKESILEDKLASMKKATRREVEVMRETYDERRKMLMKELQDYEEKINLHLSNKVNDIDHQQLQIRVKSDQLLNDERNALKREFDVSIDKLYSLFLEDRANLQRTFFESRCEEISSYSKAFRDLIYPSEARRKDVMDYYIAELRNLQRLHQHDINVLNKTLLRQTADVEQRAIERCEVLRTEYCHTLKAAHDSRLRQDQCSLIQCNDTLAEA